MGKRVLLGSMVFAVAFAAATSRSDSGAQDASTPNRPSLPAAAGEEPITGTPAVSRPGSETRRHDPFTLYDIGPPGTKGWSCNDLSAAEKAYVDRNRDATGAAATQSAYARAVKERAQHVSCAPST